jgi:quinol monooxygenase YgiN
MEKISKLQISVITKIPKGKLEEFKQLAAEHIRGIRERDTGTLKFDIFISSDQTEGETRVEFKNSEAVLEHMANHGEGAEKFMSFLDHVNVYGEPSPELLEATKSFDLRVYSFSQGLEEMIEV